MANPTLLLISLITSFFRERFIQKTRNLEAVQERFLLTLLRDYQNTEFGKDHGFSNINSVAEFREKMPILPYASYEPYIERIAQGEANVLLPDPVVYITLTSGSTGKKKLIPTSRQSQTVLRRANLTSMGFVQQALQRRGLKFGKLLLTNSALMWGTTEGGINYGPASVGVMRMDERLYKILFANPFETLLPADSVARHYVAILFALRDRSTRGMIANFPMLILRMCNYLERYGEEMIQDIEQGTIASWLPLEPELRPTLESLLIANPKRAAQLRQVLQNEGRLTPKSVWPESFFVTAARGGTSDFYFRRFPEYFGDRPIFGAVFSSAEGTFSIYPDVDTDGSVLSLETGFFEFIPEDQWHVEQPQTLLPREVNVGDRYRILISSYGGFFRYDIGDVIEVVGFYNQAPLIVFKHRSGGMISSTTEKTTEDHATRVMDSLQAEFGVRFEDFCLSLSADEFPARYLVNVELAPGETLSDPVAFLHRFDEQLAAENTHYQISRGSDIPPPRLRLLKPGSYDILRQQQVERGIPDSQLKFPHLTEDREFLANLPLSQEVRLPDDRPLRTQEV
ncbi:GH3 auxin-responsive promoter family protein [Geitlerinema sp. P-1104]|uniref:GH3 auxin-responsive promoter family protein n=1 Tax=Geitlerinema sp. P-1104 TaxID=2546230 RepID=UPI0014777B83|nr:GH3 auxin-responsive promoter family protein [Geitlerinema sp. P-1104]NMG57287.1 GH3 auxin-responsive promoter family protein [Geitlerinema sp. P-1104]